MMATAWLMECDEYFLDINNDGTDGKDIQQ